MARRSKSQKRNLEPSMLTFYLVGPAVGPGSAVYSHVDLSQIASLANRRFYRQGLNWAVAGIKVATETGYTGAVTVSKLPNTWVMANAWEKSMRTWMKMNNEALAETESVRPRFLDFKVYANERHHLAGYVANMLPWSTQGQYIAGEWDSSKIYVPTALNVSAAQTNDFELIATGANFPGPGASGLDAVSLVEGYAASRLLPNVLDPNAPADAEDASGSTPHNWMAALFNDGNVQTSEVIEDMTSENNQAPYPFENGNDPNEFLPSGLPNPNWNLPFADTMYPGGANQGIGLEIHDFTTITGTTIGGISRLKGGNFPCGLLEFRWTNTGETGTTIVQIDMIPGRHRGYLAESMTDM
jgi:hypothetical protein